MPAGADVIDARVLARLKDLRLLARRAVEGAMTGIHHSRQRGVGLEFSQFRAYEPGDDPARIDWKLYGRSDRFYVRESERESQLTLWLLLDLSGSMAQTSEVKGLDGWSKLACARAALASLAWLATAQGDAFGFIGLAREHMAFLPARRGSRHFDAFTVMLQRLQPQQHWPREEELDALWEPMRQPGLVWLVTDLFEHRGEITSLAARLAAAGKDVTVMRLLTQAELEFPWRGEIRFRDRETGMELDLNAGAWAERYRERLQADLRTTQRELNRHGVDQLVTRIEAPLDETLVRFLEARRRRLGG